MRADHGIDRDAQFRLPSLRDLLHPAFEVGRRLQQPAAFGKELAPRIGQHCAVPATVEDFDAQPFLDLPYGVSDR